MQVKISDVACATGARVPCDDKGCLDDVVSGISWDSRTAQPGNMYIAIVGEQVDGHDFAQAASDAGAVCVLAERDIPLSGASLLLVDDVMEALRKLAGWWRKATGAKVVGITGSVGKTSTKNLVRDVLSAAAKVTATKANQNNELGFPTPSCQPNWTRTTSSQRWGCGDSGR